MINSPSSNANPPPPPRVAVLATEDWFVASHFLPLLRALSDEGARVTVVTRVRGKGHVIEAAGARLVDFDFSRGDFRFFRDALTAFRLWRLLRREKPDAVHAIALKPIALASAVLPFSKTRRLALHLTGVGFSGTAPSAARAAVHGALTRLIAWTLARPGAWLFAENPDDVALLARHADIDSRRVTILGGAGVDPASYPETPLPAFAPMSAGYVGRMIWSKGVDILVAAQQLARARGAPVRLRLCGAPDLENPRTVPVETLRAWGREPDIEWLGRAEDIAGFWRETCAAVVPSRGGEGLPRALLEAAACGRPLIVTDVPGCRQFVRDGVEGFVVPPGDAEALAGALARLAADPERARTMGAAARRRVLEGYTERHVIETLGRAYREILPRT